MAYSFTVTRSQPSAGFDSNSFSARVIVAITSGTYPTGGVGPLGIASLYNLGVSSAVPMISDQWSQGSPPSAYDWRYNAGTDTLHAYESGTEISGSVTADTIAVEQKFNRL